ncbi:MAG: cupin domain-containing protein, partial [Alphaproteobacteria bacterium]
MKDPLSELLRTVRLTGGVFLDARFTAPWCISAKLEAEDCAPFLAAPTEMIAYHLVIEGRVVVEVEGERPIEVTAGEVVLLPRNDVHRMGSDPGLRPVPAGPLIRPGGAGELARIDHGGGGPATRMVCGFLGSEQTHNPLIATLPRLLKLDIRRGASRDWVEASMRFAAAELAQGRLASSDVMSRLSELLLVEAVRSYAATLDERDTGWLRGLADPHVARALALVHGDLAAPWSTEGLARAAGMSRSAFIDRFASLVGVPPIRYVTLWRLQTAKIELRETEAPVAQVANRVGYESEEAFSRAFKREFGMPPARWREAGEAAPRAPATAAVLAEPAPEPSRAAIEAAVVTPSRRASIAVMPFLDRSGGARGGMADALAHDVITRLAKLRSLFVIAEGSVFALHDRRVAPDEAGRMLKVDYLAAGSIRRQGKRLTVTVELTEAQSARIVWTEIFEQAADDAFLVLDAIGNRIVASIASEIETIERNRAILKPPSTLDAWEAHHRGLWHMYRFNREDNGRARHFFETAVRLDPTFARAYAGLSFTHFQ